MNTAIHREIWNGMTESEKSKCMERPVGRCGKIFERAEVMPDRRGTWGYVLYLRKGGMMYAKGDYKTQADASIALDAVLNPPLKPRLCMTPPAGWRGMSCTCATSPTICPACQAWAANGFRE